MTNPLVVRLPGRRDEKIVTVPVRPYGSGMQKRTPEWMVSFSPLGSTLLTGMTLENMGVAALSLSTLADTIKAYSSVKKLPIFTEVFGLNSESSRYIRDDVDGALLTAARVQHSPLVLMIPAGAFAADAEDAMFRGKIITCITVVRLGFIRSNLQILQTGLFKDCRIIRFQQQLDRLILHCFVLEKVTTMTVFKQDGSPVGVGVNEISVLHNSFWG